MTISFPAGVRTGARLLLLLGAVTILSVLDSPGHPVVASATETVIPLTAKRFEYLPSALVLKKGVPVILELTSKDVLHGFNLPDWNIRADVLPGQVVRIRLVPDKTGVFPFHCDNFCGSGHDRMEGVITVID